LEENVRKKVTSIKEKSTQLLPITYVVQEIIKEIEEKILGITPEDYFF
jgi:hypothetical protein